MNWGETEERKSNFHIKYCQRRIDVREEGFLLSTNQDWDPFFGGSTNQDGRTIPKTHNLFPPTSHHPRTPDYLLHTLIKTHMDGSDWKTKYLKSLQQHMTLWFTMMGGVKLRWWELNGMVTDGSFSDPAWWMDCFSPSRRIVAQPHHTSIQNPKFQDGSFSDPTWLMDGLLLLSFSGLQPNHTQPQSRMEISQRIVFHWWIISSDTDTSAKHFGQHSPNL